MAIKKTYQNSQRTNIVVGVIMLILAIGLLVGGGYYAINSTKKLGKFVKTDAVVIGYEERRDTDSDGHRRTLYAEIVEYEVGGKKYEATNSSSSNMPKSKGATIKIAYDPDNPSDCVFVGSTVMGTVIFLILGVAFAAAGTFLTVNYIRSRATGKTQKTESVLESGVRPEPGVKEVDISDYK